MRTTYKYPLNDHVIVLKDKLWFIEDKASNELNCCFPDAGWHVNKLRMNSFLHIILNMEMNINEQKNIMRLLQRRRKNTFFKEQIFIAWAQQLYSLWCSYITRTELKYMYMHSYPWKNGWISRDDSREGLHCLGSYCDSTLIQHSEDLCNISLHVKL